MEIRTIVGYVFLGASIVVFVFLVLKDLYKAFLLKQKGKKAFGKVISIKRLPGRDKYGVQSNALVIDVQAEDAKFTFDCLNTHWDFPHAKVPVLFIKKKNGKVICSVDSWYVLLTDAIIFFAISLALTIPYFIIMNTEIR